ncbi:MAG: ATP-binding protein [Verrucomicrobiota bacterium]
MPANPTTPQHTTARTLAAPLESFTPRCWLDDGMAILNPSGGFLEINKSLCHWLEKPVTELIGESFWNILAMVSPEWNEPVLHASRNAAPFSHLDLKLSARQEQPAQWFSLDVARTPQCFFVRLNSCPPPLTGAQDSLWHGPLQNDSSRRDMFVELLCAEARLEGLTRRWPCVIFSQRPDFSLQSASQNIKELTGLDAADWCSQRDRFWEAVHESDATDLRQQFKHAVQSKSHVSNTYRIRHALTGRVAHVLEHRQPVITPNGLLLGYEVVWLDVTRQTIAERRLSTAAWKETLAVLTLGMAHDFTNIIAGIHSLSESFLAQMDNRHPFYEGMSLIKKNSLQASQLVKRMVNLHLGETGERNYHNLNEIAGDLVDLVTKILPRRIQLVADLAPPQLPAYLDVVEFRQVIINLLLNAADAMPRGGRLTLRTSRHEVLPALENMKGSVPHLPCVCLAIEDTGSGIKQQHLASIFDPFFTTKAKGSGLGLYNARLAIEKLQGAISVVSNEGVGTTFQIWLPEADFSESRRAEETASRKKQARRNLLLLGLPGEVLDKTAELLRSHNYQIVTGASSDSLAQLLQSSDYHFDGVFLLAQPDDPALNSLPAEVRQQNKNVKLVLKLAGCDQDDLDAQLLKGVDLLLNPDLSESDMLLKLKTFFEKNG